ncbi:MAG: DNA polymerase III subunit epsilon [Pseudomonas fluorescens]|nr:MAG: DNA polymerase III subunit epsilon [Pseudomonas fluorescens]
MREIIFDTETTGFGVEEHRIIEIGCVEMINRLPTGNTFHTYLNPEREIDFGATKVHGITNDKVADSPLFKDVVHDMLTFFGDDPLVAHNADFDFSFINMELGRLGLPPLTNEKIDTLVLARQKLPGQRHNLDALCRHYDIDNTGRTYHGALLDAQLLADVYVEMHGGLQASFGLSETETEEVVSLSLETFTVTESSARIQVGAVLASEDELARHKAFLEKFVPNSRWLKVELPAETPSE